MIFLLNQKSEFLKLLWKLIREKYSQLSTPQKVFSFNMLVLTKPNLN